MGKGIDMAMADNPLHAAAMADMIEQLLIVLMNRLGGNVDVPVSEVDATGQYVMLMSIDFDKRIFHFETRKKQ